MRLEKVVSIQTADGQSHLVTSERHPSRSYGAQFMIVFTETMATVASRTQSGTTLRVLLLLPEHLNFTDFRPLNQRSLAAQLQVGSGSISRAMTDLLEMGVVERQGRGPVTQWRLSTDWGWNGTADQFHAFRAGRLKNKVPPGGRLKVAEEILWNF